MRTEYRTYFHTLYDEKMKKENLVCKHIFSIKFLNVSELFFVTQLNAFKYSYLIRIILYIWIICLNTHFNIVVREFVLQSRYYVHFRANTLGKGMNPLILPAMG